MPKSRSRRSAQAYPTPSPQLSPRPSSAFEEFDEAHAYGSQCYYTTEPPSSTYIPQSQAMSVSPPTLTDILLGVSPPPWTLSAFMAFLSQNHCMETLEFTMDTQRYATMISELSVNSPSEMERASAMWDRLMQTYIIPCSPREINIPARVRDRLLKVSAHPSPPHPSHLDEAGRIIFELMNDSLLVPFLESLTPQDSGMYELRHARTSTSISRGRHTMPPLQTSVTSHGASDWVALTDDSDNNSPHSMEPMTPPTTPPTTDFGFSTSPGGIRSAVAAHNMGWKKVGAKLGFGRKASSRRSTSSSPTEPESHRTSL